MISLEEYKAIVSGLLDELPPAFFRELSGGVLVSEATVRPDYARGNDLYTMGQYQVSSGVRQIVMFKGSFDRVHPHADAAEARELLRGILTAQPEALGASAIQGFLSSRVLYNWYCRPQFIAHRVGKKALTVRASEAMGAMRVCWTAHDRSREAENDAVIFENYRPPVRFHET